MENPSNVTVLIERNRAARMRQLSDGFDRLLELLRDWLGRIRDPILIDLQDLASGAHDRAHQARCLRLRQDIQEYWASYTDAVSEHLYGVLRKADSGGERVATTNLQLMEEHQLADHIVIREFAARLAETCGDEAFALERRVGVMLGNEDNITADDNPLSPQHLCAALGQAADVLASVHESPDLRPLLLRRLERHLHPALPDIYHEVNDLLIKRGILPEIKRKIRRSVSATRVHERSPEAEARAAAVSNEVLETIQRLAGSLPGSETGGGMSAMPALQDPGFIAALEQVQQIDWSKLLAADGPANANLVWQVRNSEAASGVGHIESATIDIVAMLFDFIFDDEKLPAGVKALVGRLQIPVLKVALADQSFFSNREHPARYFLDDISGISLRWGGEAQTDDPFYIKLEELVTRIQQEFASDIEIFSRAIDELQAFVDARETENQPVLEAVSEKILQREEEAEAEKSARSAARARADAAVKPWLDAPIFPPIRDFFETHWVRVLESLAMDPGTSKAKWAEAVDFMENLAWSISLKSRQQRTKLVALLPRLLSAISQGLDRIAVPIADRQDFLDMLYEIHSANVKAAMSGPLPEPEARYIPTPDNQANSDGELVVTRFVDSGVEIEEITLVGKLACTQKEELAARTQVQALRRGDWVEFNPGQPDAFRTTLKWTSPQKGALVFIRHSNRTAIAISPEALASELLQGKAAIIERETLFERALNYVMHLVKRSPPPARPTTAAPTS